MLDLREKTKHIDEYHQECRERVMATLSGASMNQEDILIRWIFEKEINPHEVFADRWAADSFRTYEELRNLLDMMNYCIEDDGDIAFVLCKATSPKVAFHHDVHHDNFETFFLRSFEKEMGEDVLEALKPVGLLDDIFSYIKAYEEHEVKRSLLLNEFMAHHESSGPET